MKKETKVVPLKRQQKTPRGNCRRFVDAFLNCFRQRYKANTEYINKITAALVSMTHYWQNTDEYHAVRNGEKLYENFLRKEREAGR